MQICVQKIGGDTQGRIKNILTTLPRATIEAFTSGLLATGTEKEAIYFLERTLRFVETNDLLAISEFQTHERAASWFQTRAAIKTTALSSALLREGTAILKEFWIELKHFFHHLLNILVELTGVSGIRREKQSRDERGRHMGADAAHYKLESYKNLIGIPATVFGLLYTYVKFQTPAFLLTTVGIVAALVGIIAYERYWKPCPIDFAGLKNLSITTLRSKDPIYPRQDILSQIERAFSERKGVILVGEPGAGKSWIVNSFVEQTAAGKLCPFIKDPQVFSCNSTSLKSLDYDGPSIASIEEHFKGHGNQAVFFFDEFHSLFKTDSIKGSTTADEIKTFCEDFKYVIGATTTKEFEEHIKDKTAITDRRFEVIQVGPLEDEKLIITLSRHLQVKHPEIQLSARVIDHIVRNAGPFKPNTAKIDAAQTLLNRAVKLMTTISFEALELDIVALEDAVGLIEQQMINADIDNSMALNGELTQRKQELAERKRQLAANNARVAKLKKLEAHHLELKRQSYKLADAQIQLNAGTPLSKKWLELHSQIKILKDFIISERTALNIPICLNEDLIERIIAEKNRVLTRGASSSCEY